jgi:hypothetical protein
MISNLYFKRLIIMGMGGWELHKTKKKIVEIEMLKYT